MNPTPSSPLHHPPLTQHGRIREALRERILAGVLRPHDRLPSESELMAQYGVSRITVRQSLGDLEKAQLIFKVPGKGSFVAPPRPFQELGRLQGFGEAMNPLGHATLNRLLALQTVDASELVADRLGLAAGTPVTEVRRVRLLDGRPVSLDLSWLPLRLGQRLRAEELPHRDIFVMLENDLATPLGHADLALGATAADTDTAQALGVAEGAPVLHIERLTHDREGRPVDYEHLYCRSDNFQYRLRLQRR
jgi:GntR family transcriptional regulator